MLREFVLSPARLAPLHLFSRDKMEKTSSRARGSKVWSRDIYTGGLLSRHRQTAAQPPSLSSSLSARQCQPSAAPCTRRALFVVQMYHRVNRVTLSESAGESRLPIGSERAGRRNAGKKQARTMINSVASSPEFS